MVYSNGLQNGFLFVAGIPMASLLLKCNFAGMVHMRLFMLLLSLTSFLFMVLGLIKPWIMLWWEDAQNRRKVIKLYGTSCIIFFMIYLILRYI